MPWTIDECWMRGFTHDDAADRTGASLDEIAMRYDELEAEFEAYEAQIRDMKSAYYDRFASEALVA